MGESQLGTAQHSFPGLACLGLAQFFPGSSPARGRQLPALGQLSLVPVGSVLGKGLPAGIAVPPALGLWWGVLPALPCTPFLPGHIPLTLLAQMAKGSAQALCCSATTWETPECPVPLCPHMGQSWHTSGAWHERVLQF